MSGRDRQQVNHTHKFDTERLNLKKLNEVESIEQYLIEISNRFTALENLRH
jgi:hypothetical protein